MGIADKFDALVPTSMEQLITLADRISKSTLIPREYQGKPADCLLAMSMGMEIGLKPIQALQSIAVINNRTCLWGTAARALVMSSGQLQSLWETEPATVDKTGVARCEIYRKGYDEAFVGEFSLENARKAQLTGKDNYSKYPGQMLTWRAFHMAAKKAFPDIYKGLAPAEEMQEMAAAATPGDNAGTVTLALDAPVTQNELDESKRQFPDEKPKRGRPPKVFKGAEDVTDKYLEGIAKKNQNQEPQAPKKAAEVTPPSPAVAATVSPDHPQPESCGFCHDAEPPLGHTFNTCPRNRVFEEGGDADQSRRHSEPTDNTTAASASGASPLASAGAAANGRTLNDEEQAQISQLAKTLRPVSHVKFIGAMLEALGFEKLSDLPANKIGDAMNWMDAHA